MQKDIPKKGASVGPLPSLPCTPPRHSHGARSSNVFQGVQHRKTDREVPDRSNKPSTRPGSAFTPYSPLPGIGNIDQDSEITAGVRNLELNKNDRVVHSPSSATASPAKRTGRNTSEGTYPEMRTKRSSSLSSIPSNNRKVSRREVRSQQFARRKNSQKSFSVTDEQSQDEERLLIALKLPEGDRLQRYFRPTDSISDIVSYAEKETSRSLSDCNVFTSDVPKRIIPDPCISLSDAGFGNRTLLYLEEKDE